MHGLGLERLALLLLLLTAWNAPPARAVASLESAGAPAGLEVLCNGDCVVAGEAPDRGDGTAFDFELALRLAEPGLDLMIETAGSAYLVWPLDAAGAIQLEAGEVRIDDGIDLESGAIELTPPRDVTLTVSDLVLDEPEAPRTIGGSGVSLVDSGGALRIRASAAAASPSIGGMVSIDREGDVYLDLAGLQLASLSVRAGVSIVSREERLSFVPEPSTALLLGLGLAALGRRNGRRGAWDPAR